jgi:hypothetical protein
VVTLTEPDPPAAGSAALDDPRLTVQAIPVWFTVKVWVAMVAVNTRGEGSPFAGMVKVTLSLPAPAAGVALKPVAVHGHPARDDVTFTVAVPPAAVALTLLGLMASVQVDPNCVIE